METTPENIIIGILIGIAALSAIVYQSIPFRTLPKRHPGIAFFPKYKATISLPPFITESESQSEALEKLLLFFGFEPISHKKKYTCYVRYSSNYLLANIIPKARIRASHPKDNKVTLYLGAQIMTTYDKGIYYTFLKELKEKMENYTLPD